MSYSATYSPEDNKLRLYSGGRLDTATYDRVKGAGFIYAPKQGLFVAPMWTPGREDLLVELCGDIGDEDTTLAERADERAERFDGYSENRMKDAQAARSTVEAIAGNIPFGQPILVGHHSERRARRDAEKIENGTRRAVKMWDTSDYWTRRASGALAHAKYLERPDVRYRRIKKLEAEKRKSETSKNEDEKFLQLWAEEGLSYEKALMIAGYSRFSLPKKEGDDPNFNLRPSAYNALSNNHPNLYAPRTLEEVIEHAKKAYPKSIARHSRWIAHYENRIAYERAMLGEQGGIAADKFDIQPGGRVLVRGEWVTVVRVNRKNGAIVSVSTNARFVRVRQIEEIKDYQAPTEEAAVAVQAVAKLPPLVNFKSEGCFEMTSAEYKEKNKDYKRVRTEKATSEHGAYRHRCAIAPSGNYRLAPVFLTDAKQVDRPAPVAVVTPAIPAPEREARMASSAPATETENTRATLEAEFSALRQVAKNGVQVISAPQLFPTPVALAARMVEESGVQAGMRVLEPSAGTGRILEQLPEGCHVTAVEINASLGGRLDDQKQAVIIGDFLACSTEMLGGQFDVILMNPPFVNADDIKHIRHAFYMLKEGGRLVAICANGPRQTDQLRPFIESQGGTWEPLADNTFEESGTGARTVLMVVDR